MATDCEFLADVLKDGAWHSTAELLRYSIEERGCGLTVHSRVSDLRARGHNVEYRRVRGERASAHQYRLVRTVRERENSADGRLLADGTPSYGPSDGPGSAEPASPSPGPPSTPAADPALQLLIWEAA